MTDWAILLALVAAVAGMAKNIAGLVRAWRSDRAATTATLKLVALYVLYGAAGIGFLATRINGPAPSSKALAGTAFIVAWILYGALWLVRLVPRTGEIPLWIARCPGPADAVLVAAGVAGLAAFLA